MPSDLVGSFKVLRVLFKAKQTQSPKLLSKALKRMGEVDIVTGMEKIIMDLVWRPRGNVTSPICKCCGYTELK